MQRVPGHQAFNAPHDLLHMMDFVGIPEALVFHSLSRDCDSHLGNRELLTRIEGEQRLRPCWVLHPEHGLRPSDRVQEMLDLGVRAVRLFPTRHRFSLLPWVIDDLLAELASYRIPTLVDFGNVHWSDKLTDWANVQRICSAFPELPVVLLHEGLGASRHILNLMARCPNLHVELSYCFQEGFVETACSDVGHTQLLFGTATPEYDPGPAMSALLFSRVHQWHKQAIAGENLRRLMEAAR